MGTSKKGGIPQHGLSDRVEAARQLDRNEERSSFVGLSRHDNSSNADSERHVRDIVSGVTRWRRYLDFLIDFFYRGHAAKMEPSLRTVLRIGIYEILFTQTPDHAALNEAVEAAKVHVRREASGITNGILRSVLRSRDSLPEPKSNSECGRLAILYSHPDWMVERWFHALGAEATLKFLKYNNERPVYGVHIIKRREKVLEALKIAGVEYEKSPYLEDFIRIRSVQCLLRGGFLKDGSLRIQDEAAALVVRVLDPQPGERILDMCAAPGGKAVYAAYLMKGTGCIVASDVHRQRLELVRESAAIHGLDAIQIELQDGTTPVKRWREAFDRVLIDVPCTGFGVLSKRADMRWQRTEKDLSDLVLLQRALLDAAAFCVKPGGILVYSTCTTDPAENMNQIALFLDEHSDFERDPIPDGFPGCLLHDEDTYLSLPFETHMDGAFAVRLRKKGAG